tara:strand:- start:16 stop:969 length:954 start_codon:yes stop_codon:yes gene_type:complete
MLPSLASLSIEGLYTDVKRQRLLELQVSRGSDRLHCTRPNEIFNVGCISAAEMIISKTTLDAIVKSKTKGTPVHEALQGLYKLQLLPVWFIMKYFTDQIKERFSTDPLDRDIARCNSLLDLKLDYKRDLTEAVAAKYESFLICYLAERGLSMDELMSQVEYEDDEDDEGDEDHGQEYYPGIPGVLMEYFTRPFTYAKSKDFTDTVRARVVDAQNEPCVAIVMMSFSQDPFDKRARGMTDSNGTVHEKPAVFVIQGIVACPIYKLLRRVSVGSAFLRYFEGISEETNRYIIAFPIGNLGWKSKLKNSTRVLLFSSRDG